MYLNIRNNYHHSNKPGRPSDDPLKVSKIIDLKNEIKQNKQYKTTIEDAIDFTNVQDSALANATNSLQRIHTLTQQAANGTYNTQDRQAIKTEIENEVETMMDSLNTNFWWTLYLCWSEQYD
ncbi:MAG: hypothetical protein U5K84_10940 [Alkalibacterium sp.]|nr:hypothetical protein [Alkalibacterium sp.]